MTLSESTVAIKPGKVLLVGEAMALFTAEQEGDLAEVESFGASVAGAELNVCVGLSRLGQKPVYMTKLAHDPAGDRIRNFMEKNGIDTSLVSYNDDRLTGFMMKSKVSHGDPKTAYWRKNSAASTLSPADVDAVDFSDISLVHLTGILPPLSETTLAAAKELIVRARENGAYVSFDPNLRPAIWPSLDLMRKTLVELASQADLVLPGVGEGRELFGADDLESTAQAFIDNGAKLVVVKDGPAGAYATDGKESTYVHGFVVDHVVDTVGCGDGFAAGTLSALMDGRTVDEALERGCALGAIQTQFISDNEGLPTPEELKAFTESHPRAK
ncbi:sugar kinase [Bifidobacterium sp. 82T24]|uniref:2-dehydro-3-deoxygluconokinase n=2 Tax=Bifidobacterium TaxID=1678 RepID=A0A2M9H971_9BIFI|nr:sugar kinase [Bifidobacterium sp. SMB2]MBW3088746.1 sugar kinase [Bifidobacterium pluvialisilvae]NEG96367.1 sugar kinase [Bifidobacterium sp. SMB2]NEH11001.1 sugar kinase [Bifidobacterium saimiriisciurei]PJM73368.1 2-dehydro-3-deoxygluconokinase [Bifidobacterium primatium]